MFWQYVRCSIHVRILHVNAKTTCIYPRQPAIQNNITEKHLAHSCLLDNMSVCCLLVGEVTWDSNYCFDSRFREEIMIQLLLICLAFN